MIAGFTAAASLNTTRGRAYYTTTPYSPSVVGVVPALFRNPAPFLRNPAVGFLDRCNLGCWLNCRYVEKNEPIICDLACGCLG